MDILLNMHRYYFDNEPALWPKKTIYSFKPKGMFEVCVDVSIKMVILCVVLMILYLGTRVLLYLWRLHCRTTRELEALTRRLMEYETERLGEAGGNAVGIGEGDNINIPGDDNEYNLDDHLHND